MGGGSARQSEPSSAPKAGKHELPESIPTVITVRSGDKEYSFVRSIKRRVKPVPRAFDVEYRLSAPAEHPDSTANGCRVLRTNTQARDWLVQNDISASAADQFDFSLRYGEHGELTEHGRKQMERGVGRGRGRGKRKGGRLIPKRQKKQRGGGIISNHPLARCVQILFDVMSNKEAVLFNEPVKAKHAPGYFDKISEPMDLGTIFSKLKEGSYGTAHEVRKDVTLVWKNCLTYNGSDSDITGMADFLAEQFDEMFDEAVKPPAHLGMKEFKHGPDWINKKVECYWAEDREWYPGVILQYDPEKKNEQGLPTRYRIKYMQDDEDEWMDMPTKDVAIIDNWEGMSEQIDPWEGFVQPIRGGTVGGRTARARTTTKLFTPNAGPASGNARRGKRGRPSNAELAERERQRKAEMEEPELEDEQEVSYGTGTDKVSSDFICDDGQPSGEVCRCRLLFWCRFKTRKGMTVLARGTRGGGGKVERCSYSNCPHPTMSSNDRWHFVSPSTASGGRDWSELMGQTLCSSCFQQYRNKGTLVRARDSGAM